MNLAIDVGNTCVKLVAFDNDAVVEEVRMDTFSWTMLTPFCEKFPFKRGICSTVVQLSDSQLREIANLPFPVMFLVSGETPIPIVNEYATPHTLGTDRLAAAVGAWTKSKGHDALIIDVGTCITYDYVAASGKYLGGNISPGPTMRLNALHNQTGRLPLVARKGETPELGYSTETAIRSGVMRGVEYEITGYIREYRLKYPGIFVYLTGGLHLCLHDSDNSDIFVDDYIVPYGLNRILLYNEGITTNNEKTNI